MQSKNANTIENAFRRLAANEHFAIVSGMKALLDASVQFALQRHHEENLPGHLVTGDSYGWALGYQGQCVAVKVTIGDTYSDQASGVKETLEQMAGSTASKGRYVGIVMAGMTPSSFYKVEYEEEILADTMDMVAGDFDRYFQEI